MMWERYLNVVCEEEDFFTGFNSSFENHKAAKKAYKEICKPSSNLYRKHPFVSQQAYDEMILATHQELKSKMEGLFFDLEIAEFIAKRYLKVYYMHLIPSLKNILYEKYMGRPLDQLFEDLYLNRNSPIYVIIGLIIKEQYV